MKYKFVRNMGSTDRVLRIGFSLLMIYFGLLSSISLPIVPPR